MNSPTLNLNDTEKMAKLKKAIVDLDGLKNILESAKTTLNEGIKAVAEDFALSPKTVKNLVDVHHKQNFDEKKSEQNFFDILYMSVFKS